MPHEAPLTAGEKPQAELPTVIPITESADVNVRLVASNYVHRLKVYTLFDATFEGRFVFKNKSQQQERIKLFFPLPEGTTQAPIKRPLSPIKRPLSIENTCPSQNNIVFCRVTHQRGSNPFGFSAPGISSVWHRPFVDLQPGTH